MPRLKLHTYYRFRYTNLQSNLTSSAYDRLTSSAYDRYPVNQAGIDSILTQLEQLKFNYPRHIFWIEESDDAIHWHKLTNNRYALFSED